MRHGAEDYPATYCDADKGVYQSVRKNVDAMTAANSAAGFALQFATVIAPGGAGDERQRKPLRNFIQTKCTTQVWEALLGVESLIEKWKTSSTFDPATTIQGIFALLAPTERIWFAPKAIADLTLGHFVGTPFTLDEAATYAASGTSA